MPITRDIEVIINGESIDVSSIEDLPVSISYKLEDKEDFPSKKGSEALAIIFPATKQNDRIGNTFHNPSIIDLTTGQLFRSIRSAIIRSGGMELLTGKAFLKHAKHNGVPLEYEYDFYGNNADWAIDLKESTLYDFLIDLNILFTKAVIINSWDYDGTDEALPYVFVPVRYGTKMDTTASLVDGVMLDDYSMAPDYMKPSLSKYWIIFWAFKSLGYKINSVFFDSEYFRRQVMPWTFGNFIFSDGTKLDVLRFLAKTKTQFYVDSDYTGFADIDVSNDSTNGGFDNVGTYKYDAVAFESKWTYPTDAIYDFGLLEVRFHAAVWYQFTATNSGDIDGIIEWFKNGVSVASELMFSYSAPLIGGHRELDMLDFYQSIQVLPGDVISVKYPVVINDTGTGTSHLALEVMAFEIDFFRIPLGGTISFTNLLGFKKYKFLDFLRGVIDEFNLTVQTDSINKQVYFEPTHPYAIGADISAPTGGYFNGNYIDWSAKQDLSKVSTVENFVDSERELIFKYKDDANDGTLKKIQDRNTNKLAVAKYVFPDRFKAGKKEIENRFFSPTMHYDVEQWKTGSTESPQMVIMVPENVSNTSRGEAQNTFNPKSCYYKGTTSAYKWVFDGEGTHPWPQMFAVNYKAGGENDPILSYADETIGPEDTPVIGKGLLRRFFLQRLSIMRNGIYYRTWFRLNNNDVTNFLHREHIVCRGQKWELIEINNYKPLKDESTEVLLRAWSPLLTNG